MTIDEWAIRAHEVVHSSEVIAQSYSTFNESGDPMGPRVQMSLFRLRSKKNVLSIP